MKMKKKMMLMMMGHPDDIHAFEAVVAVATYLNLVTPLLLLRMQFGCYERVRFLSLAFPSGSSFEVARLLKNKDLSKWTHHQGCRHQMFMYMIHNIVPLASALLLL